ncbi:MAG TPA: heme exporter protein CcmB [Acidimicrobiales bacterium]|nr:heme exporter protein CcmB [Acidimicrobiales bacterium]
MKQFMHDFLLVAKKDLRIEIRSRVIINQVVPFAVLVLVLFGFALDADQRTLRLFSPGLFWVAVLLSLLLAIQRSVSLETVNDSLTGLKLAGLSPIAIFLGKSMAIFAQIVVLEIFLTGGIIIFYGSVIEDPTLWVVAGLVTAIAVSVTGTLYGALASGLEVRETLLPILLLPVLAPVLIGATKAYSGALGETVSNGWQWTGLLSLFALIAATLGSLAYGVLVEE